MSIEVMKLKKNPWIYSYLMIKTSQDVNVERYVVLVIDGADEEEDSWLDLSLINCLTVSSFFLHQSIDESSD